MSRAKATPLNLNELEDKRRRDRGRQRAYRESKKSKEESDNHKDCRNKTKNVLRRQKRCLMVKGNKLRIRVRGCQREGKAMRQGI